jgi:hypothetical protein
MEFDFLTGDLNNIAVPLSLPDGTLELDYISDKIESGISIVHSIALLPYGPWIEDPTDYTLYFIGHPDNPHLNLMTLINGTYMVQIMAIDRAYNSAIAAVSLNVSHMLVGPVNTQVKTLNIWDTELNSDWIDLVDGWCNEFIKFLWDNNGISYQIEINGPSVDWIIGPNPTSGEFGECILNDYIPGGLPEGGPYEWQISVQYTPDGPYYNSTTQNPIFYVDKTSPTGSMLINNGDEWCNSTSVTLLLAFYDSLSDVYKMQFHNESSPWSNWEDYYIIKNWNLLPGEGEHEVTCKVRDKAGNIIQNIDTIKLDETPPYTTCTLEGEMQGDIYISNVTVTLDAIDNLSGVDKTTYRIDMGEWITYSTPFIVSGEADHRVDFYSVDNIGNIEEINTCEFTIIYPGIPDLDCDGDLSWTDITPGETVSSTIIVENNGELYSRLDWEVQSYPEWGTWLFDPESGDDLLDGESIIIDVEVISPNIQEETFTGEVVIMNLEYLDDTCTIDVSLATPMNRQFVNYPILQLIFERFPNAFPLLRYVLGLN